MLCHSYFLGSSIYSNNYLTIKIIAFDMNKTEKPSKTFPIICEFIDDAVGLHAYVVIDSLKDGRSCGGLRITDDLTVDEVKALAHAMTYKYCFLKQNLGGAKSGILVPKDCTHEQRTKILEAFGRSASFLLRNGTYKIWTDLNSSVDDISIIMNAAGCDFHGISDSAYFTALSVASAVKACCETKDVDISGSSVIIEGFGGVGMNLASELARWGVKITGVSTVKGALYDADGLDINKLIALKKQYKDDLVNHYNPDCVITKELLLEKNTDVLIPCARTWSINKTNMDKINAKIIVPGANAPLTQEAEEFLFKKGIFYLPDFICNLGGIFGTGLYDAGNPIPRVRRFIINTYGQLIKELILMSIKKHCPPSKIAQVVVEKNCNTDTQRIQHEPMTKKVFKKWFIRILQFLRFFPGIQAWFSLKSQQRIFIENINCIKNQC
jgi:glutamate dehydrogenase (NAD(P)+)